MELRAPRRSVALILLASVALAASPARADRLWYNGDNDNRDSLTNATGVAIGVSPGRYNSAVYDNFVVPTGQTWTLTGVFSNDQLTFNSSLVKTATWSINRGVSAGVMGTVVMSGDTAATLTAITPTPGYYYAGPEYKVDAAITSPVVLTAGTYWLSVAPDIPNTVGIGGTAFIETTGGINSVGQPAGNDGNSYITNNLPLTNPDNLNFTPTATVLNGDGFSPPFDFSMGVEGSFTSSAVPEPASLAMLLLGMAGAAPVLRRFRRRRAG